MQEINLLTSNNYAEERLNEEGGVQLNNQIEELTLMLLYLTAWEEEARPFGVHKRSLKCYCSRILDQLNADGLLVSSDKSNSVFLTSEGTLRAQALVKKYLGEKEIQLS
jgi:hypothetical protein